MGLIVTPKANAYLVEVARPYLEKLSKNSWGSLNHQFASVALWQTAAGQIGFTSGVNATFGAYNLCSEMVTKARLLKEGGALRSLGLYGKGPMCGPCRQGLVEVAQTRPWASAPVVDVHYFHPTTGHTLSYLSKELPDAFVSDRRKKIRAQKNNHEKYVKLGRGVIKAAWEHFQETSGKLPTGFEVEILTRQAELSGLGDRAMMAGLEFFYRDGAYATGVNLDIGGGRTTPAALTALMEAVTVYGAKEPIREIHLWGTNGALDQDWAMQEQALHAYRLMHAYHHQRPTPLQSEAATANIPVSVYNRQGELVLTVPLIEIWSMVDPFAWLRQGEQALNLIR